MQDPTYNKLSFLLQKEWHFYKNTNIDFEKITSGSGKTAWWECSICHSEWRARVYKRTEGFAGCKRCKSLLLINPQLASEWNYVKNSNLSPDKITVSSHKKVWWKCSFGHEWEEKISDRNRGNGCPYCSGHKVCWDNCLETIRPDLSLEWNYTKNRSLYPCHVTCNSNKKVWWKCKNGHEWAAAVWSRNRGNGCLYCNGVILKGNVFCQSIPEAYMYLMYIREGKTFLHDKKYGGELGKRRYDFYFPDENKYVEVTSYDPIDCVSDKYFENIKIKKEYVENKMMAKFELVRFTPTLEQIRYVRTNSGA